MEGGTKQHFYEKLELVVKARRHCSVVSVVPLESSNSDRLRYLVLVSEGNNNNVKLQHRCVIPVIRPTYRIIVILRSKSFSSKKTYQKRNNAIKSTQQSRRSSRNKEYYLLGVDIVSRDNLRIGLVLRLIYGTEISLDGDGGFSIQVLSQHFIFKPKCLQNLWITLQLLHSVSASLDPSVSCREKSVDWVITSPQSCVNEWHEMPDISVILMTQLKIRRSYDLLHK